MSTIRGQSFVQLVATIEKSTVTSTHYVHNDHLTGSNALSNSSATIDEVTDYMPYGKLRLDQSASSFKERKKFTGHEYDADTALSYMQARYQNPATGRFLSEDPMFLNIGTDLKKYDRTQEQLLSNPQELNSYSYVVNNPMKYVDKTGESLVTGLQGGASPLTYAISHPGQTVATLAIGTAVAVAAPVVVAVAGAGLGGYAIGNAIYNAATAPDADTRDYYIGQGITATTLTVLGIKNAPSILGYGLNKGDLNPANFFNNTVYSNKVENQMTLGDFHSFPEVVKNFAKEGTVNTIVGKDQQTYFIMNIPGGYRGQQGNFEFIKDSNGVINHRLFNSNPKK